jgi:general nucleoside transport system permease protein
LLETFALLLGASIDSGTVLLIAGLGLLVNERAGVLNLGAEGMMLVAAIAGFATAANTGSTFLAFLAGAAAGAAMAAVFGWLVIWFNTNQYATGLALSLFGAGFSAFVGMNYSQAKLAEQGSTSLPLLGTIPVLGPALFRHHAIVYLAVLLTLIASWFLFKTRAGLIVRAVGESPGSAHALGYPVRSIRFLAVLVGGALCGVAGTYVSVVYSPLWVEGMTAGKGWIALALTTFATWRPVRIMLGAYLFGGVTMLQLHLQGAGVEFPVQFLTMLPYLATILVLVIISRDQKWILINMPASLGKAFNPGAH